MSGYVLSQAVRGDTCQGLDHDIEQEAPPAATHASVLLAPGIVAQVYLCDDCTRHLAVATRAPDYAAG